MSEPLLEVHGLRYSLERLINLDLETQHQSIIKEINFIIYEHEFVGLVGPNGSGKSTLAKLLCKIIEPTGGTIKINGIFYDQIQPNWKLHQVVSMVSQNVDDQFIGRNFFEDINLFLRNFGWSETKINHRINEIVNRLNVNHLINRPFKEMSGGQKQLLAVAEALAVSPKLLILDEPTAQLDSENSLLVFNILKELKQKKELTIILITHKVAELALAERVLTLSEGSLSGDMETAKLLLDSNQLKSNQLPLPTLLDLSERLSALLGEKISLTDLKVSSLVQEIQGLYVKNKKS